MEASKSPRSPSRMEIHANLISNMGDTSSDEDSLDGRPSPPSSASIDLDFCRNFSSLVWLGIKPSAAGTVPSGALGDCLRPYLLPMLLMWVQVYNIFGFYTVLVPSLFYKALVSVGDEHAASSTAGGSSESGIDGMSAGSALLLREALTNAALYLSLIVVVRTIMEFITELAALQLRAGLTDVLTTAYFRKSAYYRCQLNNPAVDNPDQRIVRDIASFAETTAGLVNTVGQSLFNIGYYSYKTHQMSSTWIGPAGIYVFALLAIFVTRLVAAPIAAIVVKLQAAEGNFRRQHVELAVSAEAVALGGGAGPVAATLSSSFAAVLVQKSRILLWHVALNLVTHVIDYGGTVVNYMVVALAVVAGAYRTPEDVVVAVSTGTGFTLMVIYGFSQLVDAANKVSDLAGYTRRVGELLQAVGEEADQAARQHKLERHAGPGMLRSSLCIARGHGAQLQSDEMVQGSVLKCERLRVLRPKIHGSASRLYESSLLAEISFELGGGGAAVLIMGPSGSGKTAVLRAIRGLWPIHRSALPSLATAGLRTGRLAGDEPVVSCVPALAEVVDTGGMLPSTGEPGVVSLTLSQQPYLMPTASLRQQLVYPLHLANSKHHSSRSGGGGLGAGRSVWVSDGEAVELLALVGLPSELLVDRCGGLDSIRTDWVSLLSPGQRQLLSFCRLFVHNRYAGVGLALLDEASSSISGAAETAMYRLCRQFGISVLSFGHRSSLLALHDTVLSIKDGVLTPGEPGH